MKRIHVKNYQVIINEEKITCAIAINIEIYKKVIIKNHELTYSVLYKESKIKIKSTELEICLYNCDKKFMYYAVKSLNLNIILGKPNVIIGQFVAELE